MNNFAILLADATPAAQGPGSLLDALPLITGLMVVFYFIVLRPEQRKRSDARLMVEQLKKNDRIITAGGIYGIVTNVQREADRITIKIDESTNTKIDITLGSVSRVIVDAPAGEKDKSAKS